MKFLKDILTANKIGLFISPHKQVTNISLKSVLFISYFYTLIASIYRFYGFFLINVKAYYKGEVIILGAESDASAITSIAIDFISYGAVDFVMSSIIVSIISLILSLLLFLLLIKSNNHFKYIDILKLAFINTMLISLAILIFGLNIWLTIAMIIAIIVRAMSIRFLNR